MKWTIVLVLAAVCMAGVVSADTYVRTESHTDGYYRGGQVIPDADDSYEMWIGEQRLAFITEGQKMIVDLEKKTFTFVNRQANTFVETPVPLDMSQVVSEEDNARLQMFQRTGEVKKTDTAKKVEEWDCTGYEISDWILFQGGKVSEREIKAWIVTELPFDIKKFSEMYANLGKLGNLHNDYLAQLQTIEGLQVATEETSYADGIAIKTQTKVVEMTGKEPPADIYTVPEGCEKQEILTMQDLQS